MPQSPPELASRMRGEFNDSARPNPIAVASVETFVPPGEGSRRFSRYRR